MRIRGLFCPYGVLSTVITNERGSYRLLVKPGAFTDVVARIQRGEDVLRVVLRHDDERQVATSVDPGSIRVWESELGLEAEIRPRRYTRGELNALEARFERWSGASMSFLPSAEGERWTVENGARLKTVSYVEAVDELTLCPQGAFNEAWSRVLRDDEALDVHRSTRPVAALPASAFASTLDIHERRARLAALAR